MKSKLHLLLVVVLGVCIQGCSSDEPMTESPTDQSSFAFLCASANQSTEVRKTVEAILKSLGTTDCAAADSSLGATPDLKLAWSSLSDLSPLRFARRASWVFLDGNGLVEGNTLGSLAESVTALYLDENHLVDLSPLKRFSQLRFLSIANNHVSDLSALSSLTKLESLRLDGNVVTSLEPVAGLKALRSLSLPGNLVVDLAPVSGLTELESLNADGNPVAAVPTLDPSGKLEALSLRNTAIVTVAPLSGLARLEALDAAGSPIPRNTTACPQAGATNEFCTEWLAP